MKMKPVTRLSVCGVFLSGWLCLMMFPSLSQPVLNRAGLPQGPSDQKVVVVTVDNCDTSVSLRYGYVIGNYSCSAQGSQSGSKK